VRTELSGILSRCGTSFFICLGSCLHCSKRASILWPTFARWRLLVLASLDGRLAAFQKVVGLFSVYKRLMPFKPLAVSLWEVTGLNSQPPGGAEVVTEEEIESKNATSRTRRSDY
jgi:hypothetical protein